MPNSKEPKTAKPKKPKECKACLAKFVPWNSLVKACSPRCALIIAIEERQAKAAKDAALHKTLWKEANKTKPELIKAAQKAFNRFIRLRDHGLPCISCDTPFRAISSGVKGGNWDAGHYRSVGAAPELRFEESNCHGQCKTCNLHKSGNHVAYRSRLEARIGSEKLAWLEGKHEPKHYTKDELRHIATKYRKAGNILQKALQTSGP